MRIVFASLLGLLASSCAHSAAQPQAPRASMGYLCEISRAGDFGLVSTDIRIRDGERPEGYLRWDAGDDTFRNPWVTAAWFMTPERTFDIRNGYSNVMWHIWDFAGERRNTRKKLHLEFRVDGNPQRYGDARLASPHQRSGGPFHISVHWPTIAALAAGAQELYLVALDEKGVEKTRVAIDPKIYAAAEEAVVPVMREIEAMLADPAARCKRHDFTEEDSIILV